MNTPKEKSTGLIGSADRQLVPGTRNSVTSPCFIFVCGLHRSGTSVLHRAIRAHPDISGIDGTKSPEDEGQHLQSVYLPGGKFGGPGAFALAADDFEAFAEAMRRKLIREITYRPSVSRLPPE